MRHFLLALFFIPALASGQYKSEFVIAKDGSGDYSSINACITDVKSFPPEEKITIYIKNGVYKEKVKIPSWNTHISMIGEDRDSTIITWDDSFDVGRNSTFTTYTFMVDANDFYAENLTIVNSAGRVGQAVAIHVEGDRVHFKNCAFKGDQDTMYAAIEGARQYYENCYIEGTTDFIFGSATAFFEGCAIVSKSNSYITAASTPKNQEYGYVFKNCRLTSTEEVTEVYLGRPWRPYAKTVFIKCEFGDHIRPEGWHNWGSSEKEQTTFYAEYKNSGPGADFTRRVDWAHQLSESEATKYTKEVVFGDWDPR